ncbi:hypothetical protein ECIV_ORF15 [European chub iridovirus]|nr:hypothetical protein ECIV_ORF15 [European chub iridovirus]
MLCLLLFFSPVLMCYAISEVTFNIVSQDNPIVLECTATFNESTITSVTFEWSESETYILARNVYNQSGSSFQTTVYNQSLINNTTLKLYDSNKLVSTLVIKHTNNNTFKCTAGNTNLTCRAFQENGVYITPCPPSKEEYNNTHYVICDVYKTTLVPDDDGSTFFVDPTTSWNTMESEEEEIISVLHHEEDTSLLTTTVPVDDKQNSTVEQTSTDDNNLDITYLIKSEMSSTTVDPLEEGAFSTAVGLTTYSNKKEDSSTQFDEDIILLHTTLREVYTPDGVSDNLYVVVHTCNESSREGDDDDFVSSTYKAITEYIVTSFTDATHNIPSVAVINDSDTSTTKHKTTEKPLVVIYTTTKSVGLKTVDKELFVGVANDNVTSSYSNKNVNKTKCDNNNSTKLIKGIMIGSGIAVVFIIVVLVLIQIIYQRHRMLTSRTYCVNVTPLPV